MTAGKIREDLPGSIGLLSFLEYDEESFGARTHIDHDGDLIGSIQLGRAHLQLYRPDQAYRLAAALQKLGDNMSALVVPDEVAGSAPGGVEPVGDAPVTAVAELTVEDVKGILSGLGVDYSALAIEHDPAVWADLETGRGTTSVVIRGPRELRLRAWDALEAAGLSCAPYPDRDCWSRRTR